MAKRDVIEEIRLKRKRAGQGGVFLPPRLLAIHDSFRAKGADDKELSKYYPIGLVACIEGYIRSQISALVDSGPPYSENILELNSDQNFKIDLTTAVNIHQRTITIGEFVSHLLPLSTVEAVNKYMTMVLARDFLGSLVPAVPNRSGKPLGQRKTIGEIIHGVKETFQLRNIFTHELAEGHEIDADVIKRLIESVMQFLTATHNLVWPLLDPDTYLSNVEAQKRRAKRIPLLQSEMERLLIALKERLDESQAKLLERSHEAWVTYSKEVRLAMIEPFVPGTICGFVHVDAEIATLEDRIHDLKRFCYWLGLPIDIEGNGD